MQYIKDLSEIFPADTAYFYGYPLGWSDESRFLNTASPSSEELVAARPLVCAGKHVDVVVFARTVEDRVLKLLQHELGTEITQRRIVIPSEVHIHLESTERNARIQQALQDSVRDRLLIMAQPYLHPEMEKKYLIDPKISFWANDKDNMRHFVPEEFLIPELARAESGMEFKTMDSSKFPYPCVLKLSSSSGGDGVYICKTEADFKKAQKTFSNYDCPVLVLKYIEIMKEVGTKFAIYPGATPRFGRVGATKDFSNREGNWVGSLVGHNVESEIAEQMYRVLETSVLPKLHAQGWYGVGEGGALVDKNGRFYFSDFNCRVTGDTAQTFQMNQNLFGGRQLVVFNGLRPGTLQDFANVVVPFARRGDADQIVNVVAVAEYEEGVRIHGGVLFDQNEALMENVAHLQQLGIKSPLFNKVQEEGV